MAADELPPDRFTLTGSKRRILENGRLDAFDGLLVEIVSLAPEQGTEFASIQVVDSVHVVANVNVAKGERRQKSPRSPR